jgi:hypothetical protein
VKFSVGDKVTWESQSAGKWKEKVGVVERVIPKGERAKVYNPGAPRDHESYQVKVGSRRYWPRVKLLMPWDGSFEVKL